MTQSSGGLECEFATILPDGTITGRSGNITPLASGWMDARDLSVPYEISTQSYFTSVEELGRLHKQQWRPWITQHNNAVPYFISQAHGHQLSNHMHIGTPNGLTDVEKRSIVHHHRMFYNFLCAIQSTPLPSTRINGMYCNSLTNYRNEGSGDHYNEFSFSGHGTVEHRRFDANIPQCSLLDAWVMLATSKHARECSSSSTCRHQIDTEWQPTAYDTERREGAHNGVPSVRVDRALKYIGDWMHGEQFPNTVPAVKEVLFMASKYFSSPYTIKSMFQIREYDYYKLMLSEPTEYFNNLINLTAGANREQVIRWQSECETIQTLDQMIELATGGVEALRRLRPRVVATAGFTLFRSYVEQAIRNNAFNITRINEARLPSEQVTRKLEELITRGGNGFTNPMTAQQIASANERFYVFNISDPTMRVHDIIACIAIRISTGEVNHLVVDRRFRHLGIAQKLLAHVIAVAQENNVSALHSFIKIGNEPSVALFTANGFTINDTQPRAECHRYEKRLIQLEAFRNQPTSTREETDEEVFRRAVEALQNDDELEQITGEEP